jgi:hypothetical protein
MKHPNLVCLYGGCAEPPNLYLVMELVAHGAASDLLRTKTTDLPWPLRFAPPPSTAPSTTHHSPFSIRPTFACVVRVRGRVSCVSCDRVVVCRVGCQVPNGP